MGVSKTIVKKYGNKIMIKTKCFLAIFLLTVSMGVYAYAELNEAEEQVVFYLNYLQEMSYTAEHTEGMPKKDVTGYLDENISYISEAYKMSPDDIHLLMLHRNNKKPLSETYKGPTIPTDEHKMELNKKMKESVKRYNKKLRQSGGMRGQILTLT